MNDDVTGHVRAAAYARPSRGLKDAAPLGSS